jgi:ketosteroid isomerase-like protein
MTPTEVARGLIASIEAGDVDGAADWYAEDVVTWRNLDGRELAKPQVRKILAFLSSLEDLAYQDVRIQETADGFVQQHVLCCKSARGEDVRAAACLVATVRDGKLARIDEYLDSAAMAPLLA